MASRQAVLGVDDGAFFHAAKPVFTGVSFLLDDARTGLVGENGVGKSTLLKCLTGELELNRGKLIKSRNLRVGYLPQEVPAELAALSVREVLRLSQARIGAEDEDWRIEVLLDEIGVSKATADGAFGTLSGGWQRLILIAGAARLEEPDILILDEPTNHLDFANIATLEGWLNSEFRLPMLIVSHDLGVIAIEKSTGRERNVVLIPRNSPLPASHAKRFRTHADGQKTVGIKVVEGGDASGQNSTLIGSCTIRGLPKDLPRGAAVEVTFSYAANGRLTVTAKMPGQDRSTMVELDRASGLSDDKLKVWGQRLKQSDGPLEFVD